MLCENLIPHIRAGALYLVSRAAWDLWLSTLGIQQPSTSRLLCRKLKLPKGASLHTLRHSHFSQLIADGADVGAVAARAGHANPGTTLRIYTHEIPGKSDLSDQWEKLQGKKSAPVKTQ